jgi:small subunit ribosomal protein S1
MPRYRDPRERVSKLSDRIGDSLTLCLIEVDVEQQRLVFSERAATNGPSSPVSLLNTLRPGDTCQGRVTNLTAFGAFVDLGGMEGLIHISEMSWDRVRHPGDVLHPGQEVTVYVVGVNPDERRIALSLKRLRPDPWKGVESRYQVGQIVEGTVTNVVSFGAFVRLEEGLEGLIHISELAEGSFLHPRSVVHEGDKVQVRVLNIDKHNHRLGLSLRQAYTATEAISGERLEHEPPT